jgi:hypothetical protein
MLKHYKCSGTCQGSSEKPGVCEAQDCDKFGEALEECNCQDGTHNNDKEDQENS